MIPSIGVHDQAKPCRLYAKSRLDRNAIDKTVMAKIGGKGNNTIKAKEQIRYAVSPRYDGSCNKVRHCSVVYLSCKIHKFKFLYRRLSDSKKASVKLPKKVEKFIATLLYLSGNGNSVYRLNALIVCSQRYGDKCTACYPYS